MKASVILLAGGSGSRMGTSVPKQFLSLKGKPIVSYSFDVFCSLPEVVEIIVACAPEYRHFFKSSHIPIHFASPGERRQDSVYNGLQALTHPSSLVCIHDTARPFINPKMIRHALSAAYQHGAAVVGMPIKFTLKESDSEGLVRKTLPRSKIWEIQTPQVIKKELLQSGFAIAKEKNLTVTDDVSLVELQNLPVQIVEGAYSNIKITTPEDLIIAEAFLNHV